jgi:VWFA-related protein
MQTGKRYASWGVLLIVMLVLAAGTKRLIGQNPGDTTNPITPAVDSSWPEVNLNVIIVDAHDVPQKVDERKFQLFEDGIERPLKVLSSPGSPLSLTLMIDSSNSAFKRKDAIMAGVKAIVKGLPDRSEVMVIDFNTVAYIDIPFTDASKVDFSLVDRLQASGSTALYDSVVAAEEFTVSHAKYPRRALVILSDGQDNTSFISIKALNRKMEQLGAPVVYACLISKKSMLQRKSMAGQTDMRYLARNGGGTDFYLDPDPEATGAQIAYAIRNQYVLQFTTADRTRDGERGRKLTVRLPDKGVQIHALPEYFAPDE